MGHITSIKPFSTLQMDIFYLMKYYKQNHGYKYILCVVDVFTRMSFCLPMKTKEIAEVYDSIEELLKIINSNVYKITTDNAATFLSHEVQKLLKKHDIYHDVVPVNDHRSLGIIDRFARTLKTILHKSFIKNKNTVWSDILEKVIKNYNNTPNSGVLDLKPIDCTKGENIHMLLEYNLLKRKVETTLKNEFEIGNYVRIKKTGYDKKREGIYSNEIYVVEYIDGKRILLNNQKWYVYDMLIKVKKKR